MYLLQNKNFWILYKTMSSNRKISKTKEQIEIEKNNSFLIFSRVQYKIIITNIRLEAEERLKQIKENDKIDFLESYHTSLHINNKLHNSLKEFRNKNYNAFTYGLCNVTGKQYGSFFDANFKCPLMNNVIQSMNQEELSNFVERNKIETCNHRAMCIPNSYELAMNENEFKNEQKFAKKLTIDALENVKEFRLKI